MNFWLISFGVCGVLDVIGAFAYQPLHLVCKPFLMLTLLLFFWNSIHQKFSPMARWVIGALFFSWAGDIFLMFAGEAFFIAGLSSFLIAHLLYLGAYQDALPTQDKRVLMRKPYLLLPFLGYLVGFYAYLYPFLGELVLPVGVYATVITAMGLLAVNRQGFTTQASYQWILIGALSFAISDSILSTNLFAWKNTLPFANGFVMLTYIFAQFAITKGAIAHIKAKIA
jgi:uncharacterized membrane protein YhhN